MVVHIYNLSTLGGWDRESMRQLGQLSNLSGLSQNKKYWNVVSYKVLGWLSDLRDWCYHQIFPYFQVLAIPFYQLLNPQWRLGRLPSGMGGVVLCAALLPHNTSSLHSCQCFVLHPFRAKETESVRWCNLALPQLLCGRNVIQVLSLNMLFLKNHVFSILNSVKGSCFIKDIQ